MTTQRMTVAQTASLIRRSVKEAFPDVKFHVRSQSDSGGASVSVEWLDGPNQAQVETIAHRFRAAYFDGSIDDQGSRLATFDGRETDFGADFVHCQRSFSRTFCEKFLARFRGKVEGLRIAGRDDRAWIDADDFDSATSVHRKMCRHSDRLSPQKSPTAERVRAVWDDGYSDSLHVAALRETA